MWLLHSLHITVLELYSDPVTRTVLLNLISHYLRWKEKAEGRLHHVELDFFYFISLWHDYYEVHSCSYESSDDKPTFYSLSF